MRVLLSAVCMTALLTGCLGGASSTQGVTKAGEKTSGFMGLSRADDIKVTTADAFKDTQDVVIGGFAVGFATYKTSSAKAGIGGGGKSTAKSKLNGIDDTTMQKITDEAYKDFANKLKANGYNVINREGLASFPAFAKSKTYPIPYEDNNAGFFGKGSITKYFAPTGFGAIPGFLGDIPTGFTLDNPAAGAIAYAEQNKQKVLHVVYIVDFANADEYGGSFRTSSAVNVGQGITIVPDLSKVSLLGGQGGTFSSANGSLVLGQPIGSDKEFATVTDATSGTAKGMEIAANVIGILGGIGTNTSREFEFAARPAPYKTASVEALRKANSALTEKMQSLK